MRAVYRALAAIELLLLLPAIVFFGALFLRAVQPVIGTGRVVSWYAHHVVLGLYVALVAMPVAALITGSAVMWRSWRIEGEFRRRALQVFTAVRGNVESLLIAASTLMAGAILALVAMHLITA